MITQTQVKEVLSYNKDTGLFRWEKSMPPRGRVGEIAGVDNNSGYIKIGINGKRYYAHRLAFLYITGKIPKEVDHINRCRSDNRWENLRASNRKQNMSNTTFGVGIRKKHGKWYARHGDKHIGVFSTKEEAKVAYLEQRIKTNGGINPFIKRGENPQNTTPVENKNYTFLGKTLSEWSRITKIPQPTLYYRIHKRNIPPSEALCLKPF